MLKINFNFRFLTIFLALNSLNIQAFLLRQPTKCEMYQNNLKQDPFFKICLCKGIIANIKDCQKNFSNQEYCKIFGNLSLATTNLYTMLHHPRHGDWSLYTDYNYTTPEKNLILKLITLISIANTCSTNILPGSKLEAILSVGGCLAPSFRLALSFRA